MTNRPARSFPARLIRLISDRRFYYGLIGLFLLEALWIALTGKYPMAFDEDFHLGIIRLYAHHLSPFWAQQPDGANSFGALTRDPSYLFHYAMSFPYRVISAITDNAAAQVLFLRVINIAMLASALPLFRRLLLKTGASLALVHICLAVFVLVPITPLLAAQINYDNAFIPLTALVLLQALAVCAPLRRTHHMPLKRTIALAALLLLTCLVKYAFLPIGLAVVAYVLAVLYRHGNRTLMWPSLKTQWRAASKLSLAVLIAALVILSGLFVERFGLNLAHYHKPVPDCSQVLSVEQCSAYGPWARDYHLAQTHHAGYGNPIGFTWEWVYGLWLRSFFAVDGPSTHFQTRGPLVVPSWTAIVAGAVGLVLTAVYWRRLLARYSRPVLTLFAVVIGCYLSVLWLDGYQSYSATGQPVAINGRYLLPILPLLLVITGLAYGEFLRGRADAIKLALALVVVLGFVWGGGALTYILRSNDAWYWPNTATKQANHFVQRTLGPITPGYRHPIQFLR